MPQISRITQSGGSGYLRHLQRRLGVQVLLLWLREARALLNPDFAQEQISQNRNDQFDSSAKSAKSVAIAFALN